MKYKFRKADLLFLPLLIVVVYLAQNIYFGIIAKNTEYNRIQGVDEKVIKELKNLRNAQDAYFKVNSEYAPTWDSLADFLVNGQFVITSRKESIVSNNGNDSLIVKIDTLGRVAVYDSLTTKMGYNKTSIRKKLGKAPVSDSIFSLYVNNFNGQHVVEVVDVYPLNPLRQREEGGLPVLKFGSKAASTLKGSWE